MDTPFQEILEQPSSYNYDEIARAAWKISLRPDGSVNPLALTGNLNAAARLVARQDKLYPEASLRGTVTELVEQYNKALHQAAQSTLGLDSTVWSKAFRTGNLQTDTETTQH